MKAINNLLEVFQESKSEYETAQMTIDYCERAYIDLAHACELTNFNAFEGYQLAKKIKDNQVNRREAKDLREQLQPLVDLLNKHQSLLKELKTVHAAVETTLNVQRKRKYTPRTDVVVMKTGS